MGANSSQERKARLLDEISQELLCDNPHLADKIQKENWTILRCAAFEGREELVARILSVAPDLLETNGWATLEIAFNGCHEKVVLRIFKLCPNQMDAVLFQSDTVLHRAAEQGMDTVVEHLLAVKPQLINMVTRGGRTPLHCAALNAGHLAVVTRLLAASPALINAVDDIGLTALHSAASTGDVAVAKHLLAASPELIRAVDEEGWTALHCAVARGHDAMVDYLLSVSPALIDVVDKQGWTVLHTTALGAGIYKLPIAQTLLAAKPDLIFVKDHEGNTFLHFVAEHCKAKEVIEEMWRLHPEAVRVANCHDNTPFCAAVEGGNAAAIDLFQWHLTWEEIESVYRRKGRNLPYREKFRPVMERQCESLSTWLLPDVVGTVFEYLGFVRELERVRG